MGIPDPDYKIISVSYKHFLVVQSLELQPILLRFRSFTEGYGRQRGELLDNLFREDES